MSFFSDSEIANMARLRKQASTANLLPVSEAGRAASRAGMLERPPPPPSEKRAMIGTILVVIGLVFAVYTLALLGKLSDHAQDAIDGTGEGEGLELSFSSRHHSAPHAAQAHAGGHPAQDAQQYQKQHGQSQAGDSSEEPVVPDPQDAGGHVEHHAAHHAAHIQKGARMSGLYALSARGADGSEVALSAYAGNVSLVVNVASKCGYTQSNYEGLVEVHNKYKSYGFTVLAFPCNSFGGQEPGSMSEILAFCRETYHVPFPIFNKVEVNGENAHPVYQFLRREAPLEEGGGGGKERGRDIGWNFEKILVNQQGQPVRWYKSDFDRGHVEHDIYGLLTEGKLTPYPHAAGGNAAHAA